MEEKIKKKKKGTEDESDDGLDDSMDEVLVDGDLRYVEKVGVRLYYIASILAEIRLYTENPLPGYP